MNEFETLVDELVAKGGPTMGQIKTNQDPVKVARLLELGYNEPVKEKVEVSTLPGAAVIVKEGNLGLRLKKIETILADHEKRIKECSIRR